MDVGDGRRRHLRVQLAKRSGRNDGNNGSGRAGVCGRRRLYTAADARNESRAGELNAPRIREGEGMIIGRFNLTAIGTPALHWGDKMLRRYNLRSNSARAGNGKLPMRLRIVLCALTLAGSAAAQSGSNTIAEPVLGLVFDAGAQTVRTLMGIPAASQVGGTLDGTPLSAVAIASGQGYALALEKGTDRK